jgi:hypothetical protein
MMHTSALGAAQDSLETAPVAFSDGAMSVPLPPWTVTAAAFLLVVWVATKALFVFLQESPIP